MLKKSYFAFSAVILGLVAVRPTYATFHLTQIEQVIGGVNGDTTAQAIQLRMRAIGQNFVGPARLRAWDAAGLNPVVVINFASNVLGGAGRRILITSPNFSCLTAPNAVPDFIMTSLIPQSYLAAGSLTFENDLGTQIWWRLSWGGASYTGSTIGVGGVFANDTDGQFGPPFPSPLPSSGLQALQFTGPFNALSTNNAADYALTAGGATFTNNGFADFTVQSTPQSEFFINFETLNCPVPSPICGATFSGGNGCAFEFLFFCYSSGIFSYKVTPAFPLTITMSSDLNSLEVFFVHQGAASGEMRFFDAVVGGVEVDSPLLTSGDCVSSMPCTQRITFTTPVRRIEVTATGGLGTAVWIDDFHANPPAGGDCNSNLIVDSCEILTGASLDCNLNTVPDDCEFPGCPGILEADMNCDGLKNGTDVQRFVDTLVAGGYTCQADVDQNGLLNLSDVPPFVSALLVP